MKRPCLLLCCLGLAALLAACTDVTPTPEAELDVQVQSTQEIEPEAKHFIDDSEAKGGEAAILYETGRRATFKLDEVPSGRYKVSVQARADEFEGYPVMRLHRNGERLGKDNPVRQTRFDGSVQRFGKADLEQGDALEAEFTNDRYRGSEDKDRNLIVDYLILEPVGGATETVTRTAERTMG